jgi:hypothetical protein
MQPTHESDDEDVIFVKGEGYVMNLQSHPRNWNHVELIYEPLVDN